MPPASDVSSRRSDRRHSLPASQSANGKGQSSNRLGLLLRQDVISHHQADVAHADWIIDLGPGAGHDGDRIVFEGTPAGLVGAASTLSGTHLGEYAGSA